jgi:hypothetical protein
MTTNFSFVRSLNYDFHVVVCLFVCFVLM